MTVALVVIAAVLGFAGGLFLFKRSNRWCTHCGYPLRCERCRQVTGYNQRRYT